MQEYLNKNCAECGEQFKENDDIAVCPYCGTPVHRDCWSGHCPNEAKHAEGYDWNMDNEKATNQPSKGGAPLADRNVCSVCKNPIDDRPVYCPDCGAPMHMKCYLENRGCPNTEYHDGSYYDEENIANPDGTPKIYIGTFDSFADKVIKHPVIDRETGEPMTCHGVTQAELVHFLGKDYISTPRYMGIFMRMSKTGKKSAFNLWQGLLMPYYQFYQRMIGPGIILLVLSFILGIPQLITQAQIIFSNMADSEPVINAQMAEIINILSFVTLGIQIALAFFGDYLYMRWTVNRILSLREKNKTLSDAEYYELLERKGNPRWYFILIGAGLSLLFSYIFTLCIL